MRTIFLIILFSFIGYAFSFVSGGILFFQKYTFFPGDLSEYIQSKSFHGILEIITPHILAFSTANFVVLHLIYFYPVSKKKIVISIVIFMAGILEVISSAFVLVYGNIWSVIKILSFFVFYTGITFILAYIVINFRKYHRV